MTRLRDLTGQVYGQLSVLERAEYKKNGHVYWTCKCSCGNVVDIDASRLQARADKRAFACPTCADIRRLERSKGKIGQSWKGRIGPNFQDISGNKYNFLTVIRLSNSYKGKIRLWECLCDCGKTTYVRSYHLRNNKVKSCGHLNGDGTKSTLRTLIRQSTEYKNWRTSVYVRDGYKCLNCKTGKGLNAHHIIKFSSIMKSYNITSLDQAKSCSKLWNVSNGATLCKRCHTSWHKLKLAEQHFPVFLSKSFKLRYVHQQIALNSTIPVHVVTQLCAIRDLETLKTVYYRLCKEGQLQRQKSLELVVKQETEVDLGESIKLHIPAPTVPLPAGVTLKNG